VMSIFLLPALYVWMAGGRDLLRSADGKFEEGEASSSILASRTKPEVSSFHLSVP